MSECPNCGWPQDELLSRIDVAAVAEVVAEGSEFPGGVVQFTVTRAGPADKACSVAGTWSGTADLADFAAGTAQTGQIAWDAGDSSEKTVELKLNPDRSVEGDEEVVFTLSDPVDCTLGDATAEVTITNDDHPLPAGPIEYDEKLPFGGLGIGTTPLLGQPGNQMVVTESSLMILCERTGDIVSMSWNSRFDGHGRTGYSKGDGGTISWRLRVVDNPNASPIKPGPVLGETRKIKDPIHAASWQAEWEAAGGKGACAAYFAEMPTLRFIRPIPVKRGQMLVFTQVQHGGGAVSINNCYTSCRSYDDWSPYLMHKSCRQFRGSSLSTRRPEHFPLICYGYSDGVVKGTGGMGDARGQELYQEGLLLGGQTRVRQVITVPDWADGRVIRQVASWWARFEPAASGELRCRLKSAGDDPAGANDQGELLAGAQIAAGSIPYRPKNSAKMGGDPTKLVRFDFENLPRPLKKGETVYVELTGSGPKFIGFRMVRWLMYAPVGLRQADWGLKGMGGQRDEGSGWKSLDMGKVKHDCPVWIGF